MNKTKVYVAGPFFNQTQFEAMNSYADKCKLLGHDPYLPMYSRGSVGYSKVLNKLKNSKGFNKYILSGKARYYMKLIFNENIREIESCGIFSYCKEWEDKGTEFEVGYRMAYDILTHQVYPIFEWINDSNLTTNESPLTLSNLRAPIYLIRKHKNEFIEEFGKFYFLEDVIGKNRIENWANKYNHYAMVDCTDVTNGYKVIGFLYKFYRNINIGFFTNKESKGNVMLSFKFTQFGGSVNKPYMFNYDIGDIL